MADPKNNRSAGSAGFAHSGVVAGGIIAAVALAVGGIGGWYSARPTNAEIERLLMAAGRSSIVSEPGESPVRVVGGSITARAPQSWDCVKGGSCQQSGSSIGPGPYQSHLQAPLTQLALVGVTAEDTDDEPVAWGNLADNWVVEIFARNPGSGTDGIEICSMLDHQNNCVGTGTLPASGPVYLNGKKSNSAFYAAAAPDDDPTKDVGQRFHDTDAANCTKDQDLCEHMGKIVVTIAGVKHKYHCPDGACRIEIGH